MDNVWNPTLTVCGADGLPLCAKAGNVLRPSTKLTLSIRLPPNVTAEEAETGIRNLIEETPAPYNATVKLTNVSSKAGWMSNEFKPWLKSAFSQATTHYHNEVSEQYSALGGSIPFVNYL